MAELRITGPVNDPGRGVTALPPPDFTSSDQTVTVDTLLDVAHGLGVVPTLITVILKCTTNEHGYVTDDELPYGFSGQATDNGVTVAVDATNVTLIQGVAIGVHVQSTFNLANITTSSWRWVVRAWK